MNIENLCPVCGFEMEAPPKDYRICPSCGTEFGVHDANASIVELRTAWIKTGPTWWSKTDPQPRDWDPLAQLEGITEVATVKPAGQVFVAEVTEFASATAVTAGTRSNSEEDGPPLAISTSNVQEDDFELTLR